MTKENGAGLGLADKEVQKYIEDNEFFQQYIACKNLEDQLVLVAKEAARDVARFELLISKIQEDTDFKDTGAKKALVDAQARKNKAMGILTSVLKTLADYRAKELGRTQEALVQKVVEFFAANLKTILAETAVDKPKREEILNKLADRVKYIEV